MTEIPGEHLTHPHLHLGQQPIFSIPPHSAMLLSFPKHISFILKNPLVVDVELHDVSRDPTVNSLGHSTSVIVLQNIITL